MSFSKVLAIVGDVIEFPFEWLRKLTIPPCEPDKYDNLLVIVWPFFGMPVAMFMILKTMPTTAWLFYLIPACMWSFCFALKD